MKTWETRGACETWEAGRRLGELLAPGSIVCLDGDLGAGKTVFTQGLAQGLGIEEAVCSPTFTILQVYEEGRLPLYHFDVYRIADPEEMEEIGWEEYAYGNGVCVVEWSELIDELLPEDSLKIRIVRVPEKGDDVRRLSAEGALPDGWPGEEEV